MRLLKKANEDMVYVWTEALSKRSDMVEVIDATLNSDQSPDLNGTVTIRNIPTIAITPYKSRAKKTK